MCPRMLHKIHIPVMGICYTVDSPIRVAPFGLNSVISLVDDGLLEEYRRAYAEREGIDVGRVEHERVGRIRAYLDFVTDEVERRFAALQGMRLWGGLPPQFSNGSSSGINDKDRYFLMLPPDSPLRLEYERVCAKTGMARIAAEADLTAKMQVGEIQANIMVNLNHLDAALDAVQGFATSKVKGSLVLSAGINLGVFEEISKHDAFYRKTCEGRVSALPEAAPSDAAPSNSARSVASIEPSKKIILKVSDFRSALTQGRYLAKKGLEVYEYRIESGVNCGGHAFCSGRKLLPEVLGEFVQKKQELFESTSAMIACFAEKFKNIAAPVAPARITAQGGLCTAEEVAQVLGMGADGVGVGTPFLLVPQATSADRDTRRRLAAATSADVRLSHASPLGVPFMNLYTSTAAEVCREKSEKALFTFAQGSMFTKNPLAANLDVGFPCRQHYLCRELPGFDHPVCMSSREYVLRRLSEIDSMLSSGECSREEAQRLRKETLERECICRFLGNAGREELRERSPSMHYDLREIAAARKKAPLKREPVTICPGPGIAYFNREYTLLEMMQSLYGTGPRLAADSKPHAFEIEKSIMESLTGSET